MSSTVTRLHEATVRVGVGVRVTMALLTVTRQPAHSGTTYYCLVLLLTTYYLLLTTHRDEAALTLTVCYRDEAARPER